MARRKDHSPGILRQMIVGAGQKIIQTKGLDAVTARELARAVGYAPGTIYNVFRDLDALVQAVNYETLGLLQQACLNRIEGLPLTGARIRALAHAYIEFAEANPRLWLALFAHDDQPVRPQKLPVWYRERLLEMFGMLEQNLQQCFALSELASRDTARLLWACMHGITMLKLDGRLSLAGVSDVTAMTDMMLEKLFAGFSAAH